MASMPSRRLSASKLAQAYAEFARGEARLSRRARRSPPAPISGAVGTFANIDPSVEEYVAEAGPDGGAHLDPGHPARPARDVLRRRSASSPARSSGWRPKSATCSAPRCWRPRSTSRPARRARSAMPHKRNPVLSENLTGLARVVRGAVVPALENVALWHERDISHSSVERFIGPDATHHARLRAGAADRGGRQAARLSRADAEEPRPHGRARPFAARAAGADPGRHRARRRLSPSSSATR